MMSVSFLGSYLAHSLLIHWNVTIYDAREKIMCRRKIDMCRLLKNI